MSTLVYLPLSHVSSSGMHSYCCTSPLLHVSAPGMHAVANHNALFLESRAAGGEGASSVVGVTLQVGTGGRGHVAVGTWQVARGRGRTW